MPEPVRALITGAGGFVGPYLARHLGTLGAAVWGSSFSGDAAGKHIADDHAKEHVKDYRTVKLDVTDRAEVLRVVREVEPTEVYHLAGVTRPASGDTAAFYAVNLHGTLNVLDAAQAVGAAVLVVGSAYVYGAQTGPLDEHAELRPVNPYGASKAAADLAALPYALTGNRVVRVRPFNHAGPGQSPDFLLPTLVQQLALIEADEAEPVLKLGNLESIRDFTDVRDVVRAYPTLLREGKNGAVYNLASGRGVSVRELAEMVLARARRVVRLEAEPSRARATDIPELVGDARKAGALGWAPEIPLETTLDEMLAYERVKYA